MMGKFSPQLKELPGAVDLGGTQPGLHCEIPADRPTTMKIPAMSTAPTPAVGQDDEHLRLAQALLEREVARTDLSGPRPTHCGKCSSDCASATCRAFR